jgi:hypothetical protein
MASPVYEAQTPGNDNLPDPAEEVVTLTPPPEPTPEERHRQLMLFLHTIKLVVALVLLPILLFKIL